MFCECLILHVATVEQLRRRRRHLFCHHHKNLEIFVERRKKLWCQKMQTAPIYTNRSQHDFYEFWVDVLGVVCLRMSGWLVLAGAIPARFCRLEYTVQSLLQLIAATIAAFVAEITQIWAGHEHRDCRPIH